MVGFSDSDYVGWVDDKKSTSSYIFMMAEGDVLWKSVKQTLTGYLSCNVVVELNFSFGGCSLHRPLKLFCDNSAVVSFSRNTRSNSRSKYIDVKVFFVTEKVVESLISVEHTPMTSMLADPLTKGLPICVF